MRVLAVTVLLASCAADPEPHVDDPTPDPSCIDCEPPVEACVTAVTQAPSLPRSGARLQLIWWAYEDGTQQWDSRWLWDMQRGERCRIETSNGEYRCIPDNVASFDGLASVRDELCPQGSPIALRGFASDDGFWFPQQLIADAPAREHTCAGARYDRLDSVAGGLRLPDGYLYDRTLQTLCTRQTAPDGSQRCIPVTGQIGTYATSCETTATMVDVVVADGPVRYARLFGSTDPTIYSVGARRTDTLYFVGRGHCDPIETGYVYDVGAIVPFDYFGRATEHLAD